MRLGHHLERVGVNLEQLDALMVPGAERLEKLERMAKRALIRKTPVDNVEWAEHTIHMTANMGHGAGLIRLQNMQKGILRSLQEDGVRRSYWKKVPRVGASMLISINMCYDVGHEAVDALFYERSEGDAQTFSEMFFHPMMVASPDLKKLLRPPHLDKWHDRILLNGAAARFRSVSKDGSFRSIKAMRASADEVSSQEYQAKGKSQEGHKLNLIAKRTQQYGDGRVFAVSSPTQTSYCLVSQGYEQSDRRVYRVACPHCGTFQELLPVMQPKDGPGLCYALDGETGRLSTYNDPVLGLEAMPDVWYQCAHCDIRGGRIRETAKFEMLENGIWVPTTLASQEGFVGFHSWAAHSQDPQSAWHHIVDAYRASLVNPSERQTFRNTWLGLDYSEEDSRPVEVHQLHRRCYFYPSTAPDFVKIVTAGMDNQRGAQSEEKRERTGKIARSEVSIVGWGAGERAAVLAHLIVPHAPFTSDSNAMKMAIMQEQFQTPDGRKLKISGGYDDVGDGETIDRAIQFLSSPEAKAVYLLACKGRNEGKGTVYPTISDTINSYTRRDGTKWPIDAIGTQAAKSTLMRRLNLDGFGEGSIVFPKIFGPQYFESLTAIVLKMAADGSGKTWWEDRPGNEAIDCLVYAYARFLRFKKMVPKSASIIEKHDATQDGAWAIDWAKQNLGDRSWMTPYQDEIRRGLGGLTLDMLSTSIPKPAVQTRGGLVVPRAPMAPQGNPDGTPQAQRPKFGAVSRTSFGRVGRI